MSSVKEWIKRNRDYLEPFIGVAIVFLLSLITIFYSVVIINKDSLKALIEAEATILGFFGLVVVYILTSLDARIDRLEQQRFELERQHYEKQANDIKTKRDNVRNLKKRMIKIASIIGSLLIISLLISILVLGTIDIALEANFTGIISSIIIFSGVTAILLFLLGLWFLFALFRDIAKMS